jgi:glutamate--cysteine ligase
MQAYFSCIGPEGLRMMRLCCALQINVDAGAPAQVGRRWRLANLMSPVLTGMFANSPLAAGRASGWKSTRAAVWSGVDPSRTGLLIAADGPAEYLQFGLDAGLLLRRTPDGYVPGVPEFTFRDWIVEGDGVGPTLDDWHYHLTTLFPQVRPRGYFELRCIDTPPVRWRAVPVAVAATLLLDDVACEAAIDILEPQRANLEELALAAARDGLASQPLASLAQRLMDLARQSLPRQPAGWIEPEVVADIDLFDEIYTARGRCPADDLISTVGAERWVS